MSSSPEGNNPSYETIRDKEDEYDKMARVELYGSIGGTGYEHYRHKVSGTNYYFKVVYWDDKATVLSKEEFTENVERIHLQDEEARLRREKVSQNFYIQFWSAVIGYSVFALIVGYLGNRFTLACAAINVCLFLLGIYWASHYGLIGMYFFYYHMIPATLFFTAINIIMTAYLRITQTAGEPGKVGE
jgi:hypothetical protein